MADQLPPNAVVYERQTISQFLSSTNFLLWLVMLFLSIAMISGLFTSHTGYMVVRGIGGGILLGFFVLLWFVSYFVGLCRNRPRLILTDKTLILQSSFSDQRVLWKSLGEFYLESGVLTSVIIASNSENELRNEKQIVIPMLQPSVKEIMDELNSRALRAQSDEQIWRKQSQNLRDSYKKERLERTRQRRAGGQRGNNIVIITISILIICWVVFNVIKLGYSH